MGSQSLIGGITNAARAGNLGLVARAIGSELIDVTKGIVDFPIKLIAVEGKRVQVKEETELPWDGTFELIVGKAEVSQSNILGQTPRNITREHVGGQVDGGQIGMKTTEANGDASSQTVLRHVDNRQVIASLKDIGQRARKATIGYFEDNEVKHSQRFGKRRSRKIDIVEVDDLQT